MLSSLRVFFSSVYNQKISLPPLWFPSLITSHHSPHTHIHMEERYFTPPTLYILSTGFLYSVLTTYILNHIKYAFHWFLFDNVSGFTKYHSKLMIRILCKIPYAAIKNGNEENERNWIGICELLCAVVRK